MAMICFSSFHETIFSSHGYFSMMNELLSRFCNYSGTSLGPPAAGHGRGREMAGDTPAPPAMGLRPPAPPPEQFTGLLHMTPWPCASAGTGAAASGAAFLLRASGTSFKKSVTTRITRHRQNDTTNAW